MESPTGSWTYSSGNTGAYGSGDYGYDDTASSAATGSVDTDSGTITIDVPASEVGSPAAGSLLLGPQAFDQVDVGVPDAVSVLGLTIDSADNLTPTSQDDGLSVSRGVDAQVGA